MAHTTASSQPPPGQHLKLTDLTSFKKSVASKTITKSASVGSNKPTGKRKPSLNTLNPTEKPAQEPVEQPAEKPVKKPSPQKLNLKSSNFERFDNPPPYTVIHGTRKAPDLQAKTPSMEEMKLASNKVESTMNRSVSAPTTGIVGSKKAAVKPEPLLKPAEMPYQTKKPQPLKLDVKNYAKFGPPVPPKPKPKGILKVSPLPPAKESKAVSEGRAKAEAVERELKIAKEQLKQKQTHISKENKEAKAVNVDDKQTRTSKEDRYNNTIGEKTIPKKNSLKQLLAKLSPSKKVMEIIETSPGGKRTQKNVESSPATKKNAKNPQEQKIEQTTPVAKMVEKPKPKGRSPYGRELEPWGSAPSVDEDSDSSLDDTLLIAAPLDRFSIKSESSFDLDKARLSMVSSASTEGTIRTMSEVEHTGNEALSVADFEGERLRRRQAAIDRLLNWREGRKMVPPWEQTYDGEPWDADSVGTAM